MSAPLVSVMMPAFNAEATLPLAIASLQMQSYTNWECIIVNDGSTDATKDYLDRLSDGRIVVFHFPQNMGRPHARQKALDLAKGKYLAFLDADDFYHSEKLERQVKILENNPEVDLVSCGMGSYDGEFKLKAVRAKRPFTKGRYSLEKKFTPARAAAMIRLEPAKSFRYDTKQKLNQDTDFLARYLHNRKFIVTNDVLYYYSEYVSVTGKKILQTYWYIAESAFYNIPKTPGSAFKTIFASTAKYVATAFLLPIVGTEYFLKRRGGTPTFEEIKDFETNRDLCLRASSSK